MNSPWVVDVGDETFDQRVITDSSRLPVVAEFWASWCGPCRTLGPLLELLASDHSGDFILAKINIDEAATVAQRYKVRSIPTVLGFRNGRVVAEFVGAQSEPAVREFLQSLLPSVADRLAAEGTELAVSGHQNAAEERFRRSLELDGRQGEALLGLARLLADEGAKEEALDLVDRILPNSPVVEEARRLGAEIRTRSESGGDITDLQFRADAQPDNLQVRLELGRALSAAGLFEEALQRYLEVVQKDAGFADEAARKAMLDIFEVLGPDDTLTETYRSELARALFR